MGNGTVQPAKQLDPLEVFERNEQREALAEKYATRKWTREEVEDWERRAAEDVSDLRELNALRPSMDASHARGEWKKRNELTRDEAQAVHGAEGGAGEIWSSGEIAAMTDTGIYSEYRDEILRADKESRVFLRGRNQHFVGEGLRENSPGLKKFTAALNAKLQRIDNYKKAGEIIEETQRTVATLNAENISAELVRDTLKIALKEIRALDHPMYPVASLRNFDDIEAGLGILENKIAQAGVR